MPQSKKKTSHNSEDLNKKVEDWLKFWAKKYPKENPNLEKDVKLLEDKLKTMRAWREGWKQIDKKRESEWQVWIRSLALQKIKESKETPPPKNLIVGQSLHTQKEIDDLTKIMMTKYKVKKKESIAKTIKCEGIEVVVMGHRKLTKKELKNIYSIYKKKISNTKKAISESRNKNQIQYETRKKRGA